MSTSARHEGGALPRYLTSFVGREEEITDITALLLRDEVRLLTLLGPGGAGKTRLAVEAVSHLDPDAWDDIWFVPLVAVRDPNLVLPAIAQALGLQQVAGRSMDETISHFLGQKQALLVLDNLEHLTDAAPGLGHILSACPAITMLTTSRVALRISGEYLFVLPPLEIPQRDRYPLNRLADIASVRLFLERANAAGSKIDLSEDNSADIVDICRRLDGLPLALELASSRCSVLSPATLLALLRQQTGILTGGPHDAPERHRSMHDAIAWSYDLLPEHEQAVFRRLAVFRGGFSLAAAEAIVDLPIDMLDAISSLAAKSLIVPVASDTDEPRFTMLETLREFGLERLSAEGEGDPVRGRHATYFFDEALQGEYAWCMYLSEGLRWLNRLVADHANMREALAWLERHGEILRGLRMAGALGTLWIVRGNLEEGQRWLSRLLNDPRAGDGAERANGLATLSWISHQQGNMTVAFDLAEQGLEIAQKANAPLDIIRCHVLAGVGAVNTGQHDLAIEMHEQAIEHIQELDDPQWLQNFVMIELSQLGLVEFLRGHVDEAEARYRAAYDHDVKRGFEPGTSHIYGNQVLRGLGQIARARGKPDDARELFQHNLRLALRFSNTNFVVHAICDIAGTLAALGDYRTSARLFGAAEMLHETYGYTFEETLNLQRALGLPEPWARENEPCGSAELLRQALRPRTTPRLPSTISINMLAGAWAEGRTLSLDEAVTEALAATADPVQEPPADAIATYRLSAREVDVLKLVADGISNREIAETLCISERTVEHHVTHILAKLELDSRTAAATYAVRNGIL